MTEKGSSYKQQFRKAGAALRATAPAFPVPMRNPRMIHCAILRKLKRPADSNHPHPSNASLSRMPHGQSP